MDKVLRSDVLLRERPALRKDALLRLTMPEEGAVRENRWAGQARYRMALSAPGGRGRDRGRTFFGRTAEPTGAVSGKRTVPPPEKGKAAQRHSAAAGWLCGIAKAKKPFQKKQGGASSGRKPVEKGGIEPCPGRNEKQRQSRCFRVSKKWRNATFSSFHRFCLSHQLPGGKTCKVRKPQGFHPF